MMRGLWSAASGMTAQQTNLDIIANNLANVNTTGYKMIRADFQDLLYQSMSAPGSKTGEDSKVPTGIEIGLGVRTAATQKVFFEGDLKQTNNQFDVAIQGDGFFAVQTPDGKEAYTRDGSFKLSSDGRLVNSDGYPVSGSVGAIPAGAAITIGPDGSVTASGTTDSLGKIQLTRFANPAGLQSMGHNLLQPTQASGDPITGDPGSDGFGVLAQNTLEMSNVKVVEEMVSMIVAQRAYETNSKAIQAADEMLQMANQLRR